MDSTLIYALIAGVGAVDYLMVRNLEFIMSVTSERILEQVLALPIAERAELLERLLASFQAPSDPVFDGLWLQEAQERLAAFDRGELASVAVDEVFEKMKQRKHEG
jgi:putative addiction module component (TIGR02574 family)